ncbi:MAG: type II toxin-antitoxin system HicB family antitoxin [Gammaproteobacteria bacterium]|nr:type II toxin-antitoxin system HicB family antitoxin [Gammaproteobacteria bacterium]
MLPAPDKSEVVIRWSEEDACYVASLPGFGPYVKTHGATYEEAARNAGEVREMMLGG